VAAEFRAIVRGGALEAQVIAAFGRHLRVREPSGLEHEARPFGRRLEVVCGDLVRCTADVAHGEIHVVETLPRRSALYRSSTRGDAEIIVANVTLLVVVVAPLPVPDLFVVDRYLCAAASAAIRAVLVLNKLDLEGADELQQRLRPYADLGYDVVSVAARDRRNVDALAAALAGNTGVLLGQSGVGKSSLVAQLAPQAAQAATGDLVRGEEGRHTTTSSQLYDLPGGGHLIDSPGVRDFAPAIQALEPKSLGFVDVDRLAPGCRFADCRHMSEPGCAIRAAEHSGALDPRRYESYRRMRRLFDDLTAAQGPGRRGGRPPR
jgi:ribosome biogenesis GTPase / thiamine phosphate phosphatase